MTKFNHGKPFHGSAAVSGGKLTGTTDTDYFYFLCPACGGRQILQILDSAVTHDGPVTEYKEHRPRAKRDFRIAFELWCPKCKLHDFVKVSNTGWQGGKLTDTIGR
jgi:hypothetical protein